MYSEMLPAKRLSNTQSQPQFLYGQTVARQADASLGIVVGMRNLNNSGWEYAVWYPMLKVLSNWEAEANLDQLMFIEQPQINTKTKSATPLLVTCT